MVKNKIYFPGILLTLIISLLPFISRAGETDSFAINHFNHANEYYNKGDYTLAVNKYLGLIKQGYRNPFLFYNLGNAYLKKGEVGEAIIFYERAKLILPRDTDIQKNLAYANTLTIDKIEEDSPGYLSTIWHKITSFLTVNELTVILTLIYFVLMLLGILIIWKKEERTRRIGFQMLIVFTILLILVGTIFSYQIYHIKIAKCGVIISRVVEVKSGPENTLATLFSLHEGTSFSIEQQRGGWIQIILRNGLSGWIQSKDIEKI